MPVLTRLIPSPGRRRHQPRRPGRPGGPAGRPADLRLRQARLRDQRRLRRGAARAARPGAARRRLVRGRRRHHRRRRSSSPTHMKAGRYDAVVGLGGGKIIDCAKYAAARVGLPLVAVATNLSHDGLCSPVATLDNDAGRGSYGVPTPIAVVIDLDVIREAPVRFVRSGIGDAISNISAVADWELAHRCNGEDDRRTRRRHGPAGRRGRAAAPRRRRRRRLPPGARRGAGPHRHLHVGRRRQPPGLRRLPRDQPRLRPALPQARREPRRAVRPRRRLRDAPARRPRDVRAAWSRCCAGTACRCCPSEIGFTEDEFVKVVEYAPQTRPGPLHDPRAPRPVHRPDQGRVRRLCQAISS